LAPAAVVRPDSASDTNRAKAPASMPTAAMDPPRERPARSLRIQRAAGPAGAPAAAPAAASPSRGRPKTPKARLTFAEERELGALPARIDALEQRAGAIRQRFADPSLYREAAQDVKGLRSELESLEAELAEAYARWEMLESRRTAAGKAGQG
jgi:ATP-binding cassette subfamily F protein uup